MIIDLNRERAKDKIKLVVALVLWTLILVTIYSLIKAYEYNTRVEFERESEQVEFEMNKVWYEYEPTREEPVVEQASVKSEVKAVETKSIDPKVEAFVKSYRGSRIDDEYLGYLSTYCDDKTLKNVIAISVAESGMGRDLPYRQSNYFGWFKGGNTNYDPDKKTMAQDICKGVGTYYSNLNSTTAKRYTGNDRPTTWLRNVNWALDQMN